MAHIWKNDDERKEWFAKRKFWGLELGADATITPITSLEPDESLSFYETVSSPLADDIVYKVLELLGLDPDKTNAISLESDGRINGASVGTVLTVKRIKETK